MADKSENKIIDQTESTQALALTSSDVNNAISLQQAREAQQYQLDWGTPEEKIRMAHECAKLIMDVMSKKKKPFILNDEIYPEYEDWLIAANFFGCAPKIISTKYTTEYGAVGFEAVAELIRVRDGAVISRAEHMCLSDEQNWGNRPMYALRSMAQTRAAAKVMRQVFSWILVLAGYKPTPVEEIRDIDTKQVAGRVLASKFVTE